MFRLQWRHWALECVKTLYDDIGSAFVVFVAQVQRLCPDHPGERLRVWRRRQRRHALLNACFALCCCHAGDSMGDAQAVEVMLGCHS